MMKNNSLFIIQCKLKSTFQSFNFNLSNIKTMIKELTGFSSSLGPASGVNEGIQKLGNCLSFPVCMLDTQSPLLLPAVTPTVKKFNDP